MRGVKRTLSTRNEIQISRNVLETLETVGWISREALQKKMNLHTLQILNALERLKKLGSVKCKKTDKGWKWALKNQPTLLPEIDMSIPINKWLYGERR
jgi:RIO-like serine/threonine protein kinase